MVINDVVFTVELSDILEELQRQLKSNGINLLNIMKDGSENIMVQCPYHSNGQERKPSAGIDTHTGIFHCFACGEVHTLQEVISFCFGKTDDMFGAFGWNWLIKNFLTVSVEERQDVEIDCSRTVCSVGSKDYVTEDELDKYRVYHPYMWKRKMTPEVVDIFDIGYDRSTQCITFPVRDINGNTLFIARRSVNSKFFNYPSGVEKPLYGIYELQYLDYKPDEIVVCESMIDAITCWVYDKPAVALNGLGNNLQFKQLRDLPTRKLILATDNDSAGLKARSRIRANVTNKLITEYVFPDNRKDINDLSKDEFDDLLEVF